MKTLVVIAHPDSQQSSLQSFLKESTKNLSGVTLYDIAQELDSFDLEEVQKLMKSHNRIIFQFPMYWYAAPDILYKWIEKVFTSQLYKEKLKGKELGIVINMGQKLTSFQAGGQEHFTISELLKPFQALAYKCQMTYLQPFPISLFSYLPDREKKKLVLEYQQYLTKDNNDKFLTKEYWVIERLDDLVKRNMIHDPNNKVELIKSTIEANRLELDNLLETLEEMRDV